MSELKACPFCGGNGFRSSGGGDGCRHCCIFVEPELWAMRAMPPEVRKVVEVLKEEKAATREPGYADALGQWIAALEAAYSEGR